MQAVIYVDVDDTLVRSFGTKRIPMTPVIERIKKLHAQGAQLYLWSSGGGEYARASAQELGISHCFLAFLPKPTLMIDDQPLGEWRDLTHQFPQA